MTTSVTDQMVEAAIEAHEAECIRGSVDDTWMAGELIRSSMRAALEAALRSQGKVEGWRPIETAPRNTEVLVWREDSGSFIAKFTGPDGVITDREIEEGDFPDGFEEWFSDAYGWQEGSEKPTHWMPLPIGPNDLTAIIGDGETKWP